MRRHLSYANVVSTVCLFLLLGGSAYAGARLVLPKSSVGTKQIRKHAVTRAKLSPRLLTSLKGKTGPQGLTGPQGARGPQGVRGATGPAGPTFGDVATAGSTFDNHACTTLVPVSKTITLDHRGPLFVLSQGEYYANGSTSNGSASNVILLRDAADTETLATTQSQTARANWTNVAGAPFTTGGVMTSTATPGERYVAAPGTYLLKLQVFVFGTCATSNLGIQNPGLSVLQLG